MPNEDGGWVVAKADDPLSPVTCAKNENLMGRIARNCSDIDGLSCKGRLYDPAETTNQRRLTFVESSPALIPVGETDAE